MFSQFSIYSDVLTEIKSYQSQQFFQTVYPIQCSKPVKKSKKLNHHVHKGTNIIFNQSIAIFYKFSI